MRTSLAVIVVAIVGCAVEKPRPPAQEAPLAQTPTFIGLLHTSERPAREGSNLHFGEITELKGCAYDPAVLAIPRGGGLMVRFNAPVPTELGLAIDTGLGPHRVAAPQNLDEEARFAESGHPYFYENDALARSAPTGTIAPREIALWPARSKGDRRFDLLIWDRSFAPNAAGDELQSPPMIISMVGACPDVSLSLEQTETSLRPGQIRRVHVHVAPAGDGVGTMSLAFSVAGAPKGVTITERDPVLSSADWINPRETTFDVAVGPDAAPGVTRLELVARLGALERRVPFLLTVLAKDDY